MILLAVVLDTNGVPADTLKLDQDFYFSSADAHTGTKALEMRNAYWKVSGEKIGGRAKLASNDSNYAGFNGPVAIVQNPLTFSFYYKFMPVNNDTAYAYLNLSDSMGNSVGEAKIYIHGSHTVYTLASTPIIYTSTVSANFIEIGFSTAKPYSQPSYGTRFLVDDVNLSFSTVGLTALNLPATNLSCFPNPVKNELNLRLSSASKERMQITILDASGRCVQNSSHNISNDLIKINTQQLSEGLYFIQLAQDGKIYTARFMK